MTSLRVPCVLVNKDNLAKWWPHIVETLEDSDFIAIDLELSGLGTKDLFSTQIDERYKAMAEVATTRAILSMGLACFKVNSNKGFFKRSKFKNKLEKAAYEQIHDCIDFEEQDDQDDSAEDVSDEDFHITSTVFDFLCLCNDFIIEAKSMKFLVQQGFDFNELARIGIPFFRGNDMKFDDPSMNLRNLFAKIIAIQPTVVFHNGLLDLAYLYQNLYAEMPSKLETFVSDLNEMFPRGIFDTKYIANSYLSNSYLEYLFNHSQRKNYFRRIKHQPCIQLSFQEFASSDESDVRYFDLSSKIFELSLDDGKICDNYAKYGWCEKMDMCQNSHNIDLILDDELCSRKDKKSKMLVTQLKVLAKNAKTINGGDGVAEAATPMRKSGSHNSGNDAFMTGYYFLFYLVTNSNKTTYTEFKRYYESLTKFKNKIFLSGKVHPLIIMPSSFASTSKNHREKLQKIREADKPKQTQQQPPQPPVLKECISTQQT